MERILVYVKEYFSGEFILIAPPYIEAVVYDMQRYKETSIKMNQRFMGVAKQYFNSETD